MLYTSIGLIISNQLSITGKEKGGSNKEIHSTKHLVDYNLMTAQTKEERSCVYCICTYKSSVCVSVRMLVVCVRRLCHFTTWCNERDAVKPTTPIQTDPPSYVVSDCFRWQKLWGNRRKAWDVLEIKIYYFSKYACCVARWPESTSSSCTCSGQSLVFPFKCTFPLMWFEEKKEFSLRELQFFAFLANLVGLIMQTCSISCNVLLVLQ